MKFRASSLACLLGVAAGLATTPLVSAAAAAAAATASDSSSVRELQQPGTRPAPGELGNLPATGEPGNLPASGEPENLPAVEEPVTLPEVEEPVTLPVIDCEDKDYKKCEDCLGTGVCAFVPDLGKDGTCVSSCEEVADVPGDELRCAEAGSDPSVCLRIDTDEPTMSPTLFESDTEAPTFAVTAVEEPTALPTIVTDQPTVTVPTGTVVPTATATTTVPTPVPTGPLPTISPTPEPTYEAQLTCTGTGGKINKANCCLSVGDFPNTCLVGGCGCAPNFSHEVAVCECPKDFCYDGTQCVPEPFTARPTPEPSTEQPTVSPTPEPSAMPTPKGVPECTESGGLVSTQNCCAGIDPFPNTCLIGACGCAPNNSAPVEVCICEEGQCFNGRRCTSLPTPEPTLVPTAAPTKEQAETCTRRGGRVEVQSCCKSFDDFVDTCTYPEACNCSDKNSHDIVICVCEEVGQCFNGRRCMATVEPTLSPTSVPSVAPIVSTPAPVVSTPAPITASPTAAPVVIETEMPTIPVVPPSSDAPSDAPTSVFATSSAHAGAILSVVSVLSSIGVMAIL